MDGGMLRKLPCITREASLHPCISFRSFPASLHQLRKLPCIPASLGKLPCITASLGKLPLFRSFGFLGEEDFCTFFSHTQIPTHMQKDLNIPQVRASRRSITSIIIFFSLVISFSMAGGTCIHSLR
jgi:hypothetical protein